MCRVFHSCVWRRALCAEVKLPRVRARFEWNMNSLIKYAVCFSHKAIENIQNADNTITIVTFLGRKHIFCHDT